MDNGQPIMYQPKDTSIFPASENNANGDFFSADIEGTPGLNSNEAWADQPSTDYQSIGNKAAGILNEPSDLNPDQESNQLGEIIPTMPPTQKESSTEGAPLGATSTFDSSIFSKNNSMSGDKLSKKAVKELESLSSSTDDSALLYDEIVSAREAFQGKGEN